MLNDDDKTCVDIDECEAAQLHCQGYDVASHDPKKCVDVNECDTNNGDCDQESELRALMYLSICLRAGRRSARL